MSNVSHDERARSRAQLQPVNVGRLMHAVAVLHLERGRPFEVRVLRETVDALILPKTSRTHTQSLRQRVITALMVYRHELVPPGWHFVSGEQVVSDVKLDLLWATGEGGLVADELKSGSWPLADFDAASRQCASQCVAGREVFGNAFQMVRLVLPAPRIVGEVMPGSGGEIRWR
ncbi:MAG: hypothetical protein JHC98_03015 [Thermoleophilaceae bacterium]|nr:hypothetical protein [Thermoleophilaceae bacterium]